MPSPLAAERAPPAMPGLRIKRVFQLATNPLVATALLVIETNTLLDKTGQKRPAENLYYRGRSASRVADIRAFFQSGVLGPDTREDFGWRIV